MDSRLRLELRPTESNEIKRRVIPRLKSPKKRTYDKKLTYRP